MVLELIRRNQIILNKLLIYSNGLKKQLNWKFEEKLINILNSNLKSEIKWWETSKDNKNKIESIPQIHTDERQRYSNTPKINSNEQKNAAKVKRCHKVESRNQLYPFLQSGTIKIKRSLWKINFQQFRAKINEEKLHKRHYSDAQ